MPRSRTSCILTWCLYIYWLSQANLKNEIISNLKNKTLIKHTTHKNKKRQSNFPFFKRENQKFLNHNSMEIFHLLHGYINNTTFIPKILHIWFFCWNFPYLVISQHLIFIISKAITWYSFSNSLNIILTVLRILGEIIRKPKKKKKK